MRNRQLIAACLVGSLMGFPAATPTQAGPLDISDVPLFLVAIKPSIMVMLDNSGSMKQTMYTTGYIPYVEQDTKTHFSGIFEAGKNYEYDRTVPVNELAYKVDVDTNKKGAFVEAACVPGLGINCWNGNFLNWLTSRRIDASRMVMVGGKMEGTGEFDYGNGNKYKIVANNEFADRDITNSYALSADFSPVPNGTSISVFSPADASNGQVQTVYDPYAKMKIGGGGGLIHNSVGTAIGEFGTTPIFARISGGDLISWSSVTFEGKYTDVPVVVAKPLTFNGDQPAVIRMRNVTTTGFQMTVQEWEYLDGTHSAEDVSYVVMKEGSHTLPGSLTAEAGLIESTSELYVDTACDVSRLENETVNFSDAFSAPPIVISSVLTFEGAEAVNSRVWNITNTGFKLAMQEEETPTTIAHSNENVGYIAVEAGKFIDPDHGWQLEAGKLTDVSVGGKVFNYSSSFIGSPALLVALQTMNEGDTAGLRIDSNTFEKASLHIEEEESCDGEVSHANEDAGYLALRGSNELNLAVVTPVEPMGLLQKITDGVRLGISFYRYNPNKSDIYNGNTIQGGTMQFKIPYNPFVKNPGAEAEPNYRQLNGYVGVDIADIVDAVNNYPLVWGTTPLAENLWEVIQYFEQDNPYYPDVEAGFPDFVKADDANPERDPFFDPEYNQKLYCSNPSVIIFTDGEPYKDADIPADIVDYDDDSNANDVASSEPNDQGKDNLDDVAYWAYCNKTKGACAEEGSRDLRADIKNEQFLSIYTVGFAGGAIRPVLQDTADNAGGIAYAAEAGAELEEALEQAVSNVVKRASASAVAVNTGSITSSSLLYQAVFDSSDWSGDIEAYKVNENGSVAAIPTWKASENIPLTNDRNILTFDGASGQPFRWDNLTDGQKAALFDNLTVAQQAALTDAGLDGSTVLDYLRGDQSHEEAQGGLDDVFRDRSSLLGDFINSAPVWVGPPGFHYPDGWGSGAAENAVPYSKFKFDNVERTPVVYAGANDGMMHAFDALTGKELFAYVPAQLFSKLAALSDPEYIHQYYTDGSPTLVDAFFGNAWHTVLAAGLNAGGQAIYVLDVTDPTAVDEAGAAKVLWEFNDADDPELGLTYSQPNVVRLQDGNWAAVFGNGYNNTEVDDNVSASGNAVLYIVNLATGALLKKIDTGKGSVDDPTGEERPNGLASVAPVDVNGDSIVDYVYGGDLFGNLWKFNLNSKDKAAWDVAYINGNDKLPIFTACAGEICGANNAQPITTRPQVGRHPTSTGYMVYFGTGKYFEGSDDKSASQVTQTFYGIWDKDEASLTAFDRSDLLQQEIVEEVDINPDLANPETNEDDFRITTQNPIIWEGADAHTGWYMDLISVEGGNDENKGERQITDSILREGRIIFTTMMPLDDPCSPGGTGWLMEIDATNGARLEFSPFDINNDGDFDEEDYVQVASDVNGDGNIDKDDKLPASGVKSEVGILPMPAILSDQKNGKEYKYSAGSSGDIQITTENPGPGARGRQSWCELKCN